MHHSGIQVLLLTTTVALILIIVTARVCSQFAPKIGQPAVVGEMIAGILLGPTALGWLMPEFSAHVFSADVKRVLYVMSMFGLSLYMFLVGLEHESPRITGRQRHLPVVLGIAGFALPVVMGIGVAASVAMGLKPEGVASDVYVLFVGVALSITAFPMLARVLQDRRMTRTLFGATVIKAAAIDDALAWCGLAVVSAMSVNGSAVDAFWRTVLPSIVFLVVSLLVIPAMFRRPIENAVRHRMLGDGLFSALLMLVLVSGFISDYIGLYSVFGGFIAGLSLPRVPGFASLLHDRLLQTVRCLFLPIFFAYSGLNADLLRTFNVSTVGIFAALLVVAIGAKAVSALAVLRIYRWPTSDAISMAGLMNARGLMILVFITIGLSLGIIDVRTYSVMALIAVITTALAVPVYRRFFSGQKEAKAREEWEVMADKAESPATSLVRAATNEPSR